MLRKLERFMPFAVGAYVASCFVSLGVAFAQVVPDAVTNKALEGFDAGGYKATTVLACVGCFVLGAFVVFQIRRQDKREEAFSAQLAARDAMVLKMAEKLETTATRATDIAARSEEAVEANTRVMEQVKEKLARIAA